MAQSLEIDFLAVESGQHSGDAIAIRYGDFSSRDTQKIIIIDGGTLTAGQNLVNLVRDVYGTNRVDLVLCTHLDKDHVSGLRTVVRELEVGELWIHKPWEHSEEICHLFHDGRITTNSLAERLKDAYNFAYELVEIAEEKGIDIREPFAGRQFDEFTFQILGPNVDFYRELLVNSAKTPEQKEDTILESVMKSFTKAINWVEESIGLESLDENGETSSENSSSAVSLLTIDSNKHLFTGDAGIQSLKNVIEYSVQEGIDISKISFMQAPHHGSKRNISPSILDSIRCDVAYVSASSEAEKHPSRKVLNAFHRRNTKTYSTEGQNILRRRNAPIRKGYSGLEPHPFYELVQE
ncbi:ComEC/Rec2 family competence protein [Pedobacter heparinus]|uniref:ComEC/Rec2 family competence protein n=1 Tax=Pedobacter heparinus TaxID=984 RepID=UPI00292ED43C|nr:MBL fold metallo-hydrolase [Pedobacter heparinus]